MEVNRNEITKSCRFFGRESVFNRVTPGLIIFTNRVTLSATEYYYCILNKI